MEYKWTALTVTLVGTLMAGIDSRIVVVGLPTIALQLHTGPTELIWVTQSFALAGTVSLLLVGRVTDLVGRVKIYNVGFIVFTAGSALCAVSSNVYQVIIFRAVMGCGATMLSTNSAAIVTDASPVRELGTMLGINQSGMRAGAMFGLTLSGLILSVTNWRGLFYVNIPIGIFGTAWAYYRLHEISTKDVGKKMDWPGFGLFTGGLLLTMLSITFLTYGFSGITEGLSLLVAGFALLIIFLRVEAKTDSPFIDLGLFKIRMFAAGNLAQLFNATTWTGLTLLIAFYLQIGRGYSALQTGLGILPIEISYLLFTVISGRLSDRYGTRLLSTSGLFVTVSGFLAMSTFGTGTSYSEIIVVLSILGIGNGLFNSPNNRSIMSSVPPNRRGVASAFRGLTFSVGTTVSYGLIVLLISIGIPYGTFSKLLLGTIQQTAIAATRAEFLRGFRIATLCMAAISACAILPSALRGNSEVLAQEEREQPTDGAISKNSN